MALCGVNSRVVDSGRLLRPALGNPIVDHWICLAIEAGWRIMVCGASEDERGSGIRNTAAGTESHFGVQLQCLAPGASRGLCDSGQFVERLCHDTFQAPDGSIVFRRGGFNPLEGRCAAVVVAGRA